MSKLGAHIYSATGLTGIQFVLFNPNKILKMSPNLIIVEVLKL